MKIIFLNAWGGTERDALIDFIKTSAPSTDFFCLQEIFNAPERVSLGEGFEKLRTDIFENIARSLPGFQAFTAPANTLMIGAVPVTEGLAVFSKKNIAIESHDNIVIYENDKEEHVFERVRNLQRVRFTDNGKKIELCNFHGIAYPGTKVDTPARLEQSHRIVKLVNDAEGEIIIGGDFNLMPDTESISMIEAAGTQNLIKKFGISSTRSDISYERHRNNPPIQHFADFVFASPGIEIRKFEVPRVNISDHLPLILECD